MDKQTFDRLAARIADGTATKGEVELYSAWFNTYSDELEWKEKELGPLKDRKARLFENIEAGIRHQPQAKIIPLYYKIAIAASVALFAIGGSYYFLQQPKPTQQFAKNDIKPGHNQATLTLANGQKIVLTKGLNGFIARQGKTNISATDHNITYTSSKQGDQFSMNTLTTARGEQSPYPLVLADGTKVWLNAQSSITFPTAFNGKERIVKITGEALFEVAHNTKQSFKVQTEKQTIEDIGTTFDVNAYADEPSTKTTLIEGSVKVNNLILKPGEQTDGQHIMQANTIQAIAWKDGKFRFIDDNIQTVMRQLARWYDIDVAYAGTDNTVGFNARISRDQNISVVLSALERTNGVHFKIEGRRVTVIR